MLQKISSDYFNSEKPTVQQLVNSLRGDKYIEQLVLKLRTQFKIKKRPFNKSDFYRICEVQKIKVIEIPLRTFGFFYIVKGRHYIAVNSKLNKNDFLIVVFHELGHHFLHNPSKSENFFDNRFCLWNDVKEAQADYFSQLTLIGGLE